MSNFRSDRSGGRRGGGNRDFRGGGYGGGRDFGRRGGDDRGNFGRDRDRSQMFTAVCDECGNECELPFKPTQGKPVFCNDCFKGRDNNRSDFERFEPRRSDRDFGGRRESRRESHFERDEPRQNKDNGNAKLLEQMSAINNKLDRLLLILGSKTVKKTPKTEKETIKDEADSIAKTVAKEAKPKKAEKKATKKKA